MISWSITTIIPLIASIIYGGLFVIVLLSVPLNRQRRIFVVYLFSMLIWSTSAFMTVSGLVSVLPWFRIMSTAPILMMIAIFFFVQEIFAKKRTWTTWIVLYAMITTVLFLGTNLVIKSASLAEDSTLVYEFSNWVYLIAGIGYALIVISQIELIQGLKETDNPLQRTRLQYLVIGLSITILASLVNFTPLGVYPIDIAANGITAILIAYSITRYQLLEIRVVLRAGLLYTIMTTLLGAMYYLIIYFSIYQFNLLSGQSVLSISILIALLTSLTLTPLRNRFQSVIDRVFYRQRYNAGLMLERLSEATASMLHLDQITSVILDEVTETLFTNHAAIYVKKNSPGNYKLIARHNLNPKAPAVLRSDHPIIRQLSSSPNIITRFDLYNLPTYRGIWAEEREDLEILQMDLFIPLQAKGELVGILGIGPKLSRQEYSQEDQRTLTTLGNQMAVAVENARLYEELEKTFVETVVALANAIDLRDTYTSNHSQQIATMAREVARQLELSAQEIEAVYWGGLLHDIGKIGIPDSILQKPAKLDESEWNLIKTHPKLGADLVAKIHKLEHIAPLIEFSHERFDGTGYPHGVKGDEIPIGARIVGVVDSFSAMIDERPYKPPLNEEAALEEIERNAGVLYDPKVVQAFFRVYNSTSI
ncbi:MAG: HD domain-containing protein [Anaerolineales bacterium]|nr:HD domain-containing protein [Anaerolineales bacterium]